ncbi:inhibitor of apoptosis-promoting Bax1-domain-containing protein [Mrakia frigida]|uniref:Bxi1p n=1 Tax=Mrakia frigida TaxID=29902 RepID=UPI003FCC0ADF
MAYAPPSYTAPIAAKGYQATADSSTPADASSSSAAPLLAQASVPRAGGGPRSDDGSEDDFKIGVSVSTSDVSVRMAFIRKVYTILSIQLLATAVVSVVMMQPVVLNWTRNNAWFFWLPLVGSMGSLGVLFWKINQHPLNLFILGIFTLFEATAVGTVVGFYETTVVIQALFITLAVFVGLTLFTMQSKYDFEGLGPWLFTGLMTLMATSFISIFFPFGSTADLIIGIGGCLLFSGYIIFDTQAIMKRLSPDEAILGALRLYLDAINLFLQVLRVLGNSNRD